MARTHLGCVSLRWSWLHWWQWAYDVLRLTMLLGNSAPAHMTINCKMTSLKWPWHVPCWNIHLEPLQMPFIFTKKNNNNCTMSKYCHHDMAVWKWLAKEATKDSFISILALSGMLWWILLITFLIHKLHIFIREENVCNISKQNKTWIILHLHLCI